MIRDYLKNSGTFIFFGIIYKDYLRLKGRIYSLYLGSQLYNKSHLIYRMLFISFRQSFLGRLTELDPARNSKVILGSSIFIRCLIKYYNDFVNRIIFYARISRISSLIAYLKEDFYRSAGRTIGIVMMATVSMNILLLVTFNREIGLFAWVWRIALLFLSIALIFSDTRWEGIRQESLIIHWINNCCKIKK